MGFRNYIRFLLLCGLAKSKLLFFEDFLYKEGFWRINYVTIKRVSSVGAYPI